MRTYPFAFALLLLSAAAAGASPEEDAYNACKEIIAINLVPSDQVDQLEFSPSTASNWSNGDEFYFAFQSGTISGGSRSSPDWLTGSNEPSASCIGSLSKRKFDSITVNGAEIDLPEGF